MIPTDNSVEILFWQRFPEVNPENMAQLVYADTSIVILIKQFEQLSVWFHLQDCFFLVPNLALSGIKVSQTQDSKDKDKYERKIDQRWQEVLHELTTNQRRIWAERKGENKKEKEELA